MLLWLQNFLVVSPKTRVSAEIYPRGWGSWRIEIRAWREIDLSLRKKFLVHNAKENLEKNSET